MVKYHTCNHIYMNTCNTYKYDVSHLVASRWHEAVLLVVTPLQGELGKGLLQPVVLIFYSLQHRKSISP